MADRIKYITVGGDSVAPGQIENMAVAAKATEKFLGISKTVAQAQVVCGLMCVGLGGIFWANKGGTRDIGSGVWCGLYFMLTGIVGVVGAASRRQGSMTAYVVMAGHAAALFAPVLVFVNSFATYADNVGCYVGCKQRPYFSCELICDDSAGENTWVVPGLSARVIDISLVTLGLLELCLCISGAITASRFLGDACLYQVRLSSPQPLDSAKNMSKIFNTAPEIDKKPLIADNLSCNSSSSDRSSMNSAATG